MQGHLRVSFAGRTDQRLKEQLASAGSLNQALLLLQFGFQQGEARSHHLGSA